MKVKRRRKMWIALIIIGVIGVGLGGVLLFTAPARNELKNLPIAAMDFSILHDGTYVGEYDGGKSPMRAATVEVTVASGKVIDIKVLKSDALDKDGKPVELTKGLTVGDLFDSVIREQSLQVDTISGATLTSKAHLKAVEMALEQAE